MDSKYLPSDETGKIIHLMEECAEVTQACAKVLRFGWSSFHPYNLEILGDNKHQLFNEMKDLKGVMKRLEEEMSDS